MLRIRGTRYLQRQGADHDFSTKVIVGGQFPALRQLPQYRS
jgi:hypothetical protein